MSIQPQAAGSPAGPAAGSNVHVQQTATAAESAVVIQVGGDLYLSDAGLTSLWTSQAATPGECPYPGLDAFGPGQARWFFGRENVTGDLLRYLDEMTLGGPGGPLLLVAPSGTGKSSLLRAGLMTALAEGRLPARGSAGWPRVMITPGPHPLDTLRAALATLASAGTMPGDARLLLVIDQLEEIFTVCESEAERSGFLDEVGTLAADAGPGSALVVLGMRADFYARATGYPVLRQAMQSRQVVLGAMSGTEVRQAIVRPARAVGLTLEAGLTERLLRDLGVDEAGASSNGADSDRGGRAASAAYEPGRLPLLAHALRATWARRDGSRLTIAGYEATGGIAGAIARTAEDVYARLDVPAQVAARQVFLGLVRVGSGAAGDEGAADAVRADTRRRVAADGLVSQSADPPSAWRALEAFTAARLLTSGGQAVEITHEALLRRWPRLRSWIDEDRSGLLVRQDLEDAAAAWDREGKDAAALYGGVRLAAAQAWAAVPVHARELTAAGRDFLAASEARRRRGTRRRNAIIAALAALSLVLAGLAVVALNERSTAQSQRNAAQADFDHAEAGLLAAESAQAAADFRPDTALKFAAEAYRLDPSSPAVRDAVLTTQSLPIAGRLLVSDITHAGDGTTVTFNPAGTLIASGDDQGNVRLWSASTYQMLWHYQYLYPGGDTATINQVAFTPDGKTLAVTQPGAVWLWNVANPAHPVPDGKLPVPPVPNFKTPQVVSFALSPDGRTAAASIVTVGVGSTAGRTVLWNVATRTLTGFLPELTLASDLAFTPDGKSLAIDTDTGSVELWNVASRTRTALVQATTGPIATAPTGVAVSPDGQVIAYPTEPSENVYDIKLWNIAARKVTATVKAGSNGVTFVAFSRDGSQFAASSLLGTVQLWDARTHLALGTFAGHRAVVTQVAFSPDGTRLASASYDASVGLWNTEGTTLGEAANASLAVSFSPDGHTLAVDTFGGGASYVALFALPARRLISKLPVGGLAGVAFSPDGKTLATMTVKSGVVDLWDVATGKLTGTLQTGLQITGLGINIAFSPDGTLLAVSGTQDETMQVWSVARRARVATLSVTQGTQYPAALGGGVITMAFSPNGRLLALAGLDGKIRFYRVPGFAFLTSFQPPSATNALAFSPDGRDLALGSASGTVYVYSLPATSSLRKVTGEGAALSASTKAIHGVEFISDTTLIAAGDDGVARFWTLPDSSALAKLAASPTGLFTAATPGQLIATHAGAIASLSYSASLSLLATGSASGSRVWRTDPGTVAASVCPTLQAPVQRTQWTEYLGTALPYSQVCG